MAWRTRTLLARGCLHTDPPTIHADARRRLSSAAAAAHVIGSAPTRSGVVLFGPTGEGARAWARPEVLLSSASWRAGGSGNVSVGWISALVFSSRQKLHGAARPPSLKMDVIKKRNRNGNNLAASLGKSVPPIIATGAARGIVTAEALNSMTSAVGLFP